ncbi:YdhK family protein [Saccharibacillus sacchari]|uniref:YdhK family protein n=1 Tax=Saccharibacillus sacchari TaxID=456493 RepID=A0ACC6PCC2_9BACL
MKKRWIYAIAAAAGITLLGGCSDSATPAPAAQSGDTDMHGMDHGSSGAMPEGLKEAADPVYPVGSKVVIRSDHMAGMDGAEGTVTGAYDTTIYSVSYTPTDGGEPVSDHEWVIEEELRSQTESVPDAGDTVTIEAGHMPGMKGAEATVDTAEKGVIYMVDYTPTDGGQPVTNHMWVTESELSTE